MTEAQSMAWSISSPPLGEGLRLVHSDVEMRLREHLAAVPATDGWKLRHGGRESAVVDGWVAKGAGRRRWQGAPAVTGQQRPAGQVFDEIARVLPASTLLKSAAASA